MSDQPEPATACTLSNPAAEAALVAAIRRAREVVAAESRALRNGGGTDLKAFEYRKSQALLELSRTRQTLPAESYSNEIREMLENLHVELKDNMTLLSRHLSAVKEIADLVAQSMLDAESDGTYPRPPMEYAP